MAIVSRKEAKAEGLIRYFTGKPCKHGHFSERWTSSAACCQCVDKNNAEWRERNAESEVQRKRQWHQANKSEQNERNKKWQKENRAKVSRYVASWREKNRNKVNAMAREWRAANPARQAEADRKWRGNNPASARAKDSRKRAAQLQRIPSWFNEFDSFVIKEAAELADIRKNVTGFDWHIDHMIPMRARRASGLHCAANLQVIPAKLNIRKLNRMVMTTPGEWVRHG